MKIARMNKGSWGKLRAFFDVETQEGFVMKGFKLVEGINGLFVGMPSQKGSDEEYHDTIWVESKEIREELNALAISKYQESDAMSQSPEQEETFDREDNTTEMTGENLSQDTESNSETETIEETREETTEEITEDNKANVNAENVKSFSDDDLPF